MSRSLDIYLPKTGDYQTIWELQKSLQKRLIAAEINDSLIVCEHQPVITLGRSSKTENIIIKTNIPVFEIERGGEVSCHELGQIVFYPIINLNFHKRDVAWYMRQLEEVVIKVLKKYEINAIRVDKRTGVWIDQKTKISSIGVRISRWCSMHGCSLNISNDLKTFSLINPCGFTDIRMTSLNIERVKHSLPVIALVEVRQAVIECFKQTFGYEKENIISENQAD